MHVCLCYVQVVGLERIAIVIPAEAISQIQAALESCQEQHASGVVSTARVQQQPLHTNPLGPTAPLSAAAAAAVPSSASGPCTPSMADVSPQVKHPTHQAPPPGCGVQLLEAMQPIMFQPLWILPPAGNASARLMPSPNSNFSFVNEQCVLNCVSIFLILCSTLCLWSSPACEASICPLRSCMSTILSKGMPTRSDKQIQSCFLAVNKPWCV